jgi:hypothetical protein
LITPRNHTLKDESGNRYGRWTVLRRDSGYHQGAAMWICRCDCGTILSVRGQNLRNGLSGSCGCLQKEVSAKRQIGDFKYGETETRSIPEYKIWENMKQRCLNSRNNHFDRYGGRGITVCPEWISSFDTFLADMGPWPGTGYSIERVNNGSGYCKDNCRWATRKEQGRNKRNNRLVHHGGKTKTIAEWAEVAGLPYITIWTRIRKGWPMEEVLGPRL